MWYHEKESSQSKYKHYLTNKDNYYLLVQQLTYDMKL